MERWIKGWCWGLPSTSMVSTNPWLSVSLLFMLGTWSLERRKKKKTRWWKNRSETQVKVHPYGINSMRHWLHWLKIRMISLPWICKGVECASLIKIAYFKKGLSNLKMEQAPLGCGCIIQRMGLRNKTKTKEYVNQAWQNLALCIIRLKSHALQITFFPCLCALTCSPNVFLPSFPQIST